MKTGGSVVNNALLPLRGNRALTAIRAAVAARVHCSVANSPRSKACAAFDFGLFSSGLGEATSALFVPAVRESLSILADTISPNRYADVQRELSTLNAQHAFYLGDTNDLDVAWEYVVWNWLQVSDHAIPASHPYRKWYLLGLAWGNIVSRHCSEPDDLAALVYAIDSIGDEHRQRLPILTNADKLLAADYCMQSTAELRQALRTIPDVVVTQGEVGRARKGKPGRPSKRDALARFAIARRNGKPQMTWDDIAIEWQVAHPNDPVTIDTVRSAVRNFRRRKNSHRA